MLVDGSLSLSIVGSRGHLDTSLDRFREEKTGILMSWHREAELIKRYSPLKLCLLNRNYRHRIREDLRKLP